MIKIEQNDAEFMGAMARLRRVGASVKPLMQDVGEHLVESTKRRFATSTDPDGHAWEPNTALTVERFLGLYKGSHKKDGTRSKAGQARAAGKKPLIGETKALSTTIHYQASAAEVEVGSNRVQAAVMQGGAKARSFAGHRSPWGDIPARPYLGLSSDDRAVCLALARDYLDDLAEGRTS